MITLTIEEKKHLDLQLASENDPGYYLSWNFDVINLIINDLQEGVLQPTVPPPEFLQLDSTQ